MVSPLVRALETALVLFKSHHNQPKILVVPWMREHLHSTCDVPSNFNEVRQRFEKEYPNIDFSLFDRFEGDLHWFLRTYQPELQ